MSAANLDPTLRALVDTLDISKAPDSVQCGKCKQFLINSYKGICCDIVVCESCYDSSNNECLECHRTPWNLDCKIVIPAKSSRATVKAWLKGQAKIKAAEAEQLKSIEVESTPAAEVVKSIELATVDGAADLDMDISQQANDEEHKLPVIEDEDILPSTEMPEDNGEPHSDPTDAGDDEVEIQVEPSQEDMEYMNHHMEEEQQDEDYNKDTQQTTELPTRPDSREQQHTPDKTSFDSNSNQTNNAGYGQGMNNTDFQNMMNMMQQNPMAFNPMMSMPMGMNPMSMFGNFGGSNGGMNGMNGMNMGMNFNPGMLQAFQNNMFQNSNAFSNGMGNDFNNGFGFNQQQNYPNGDFNYQGRGHGRGRGRGRGGIRGRGNYSQYQNRFNNFQNPNEQQQFEIQNMQGMQPQRYDNRRASRQEPIPQPKQEEPQPDDDEFAPGGQEEVQEALGDDYVKKEVLTEQTNQADIPQATIEVVADQPEPDIAVTEQNGTIEPEEATPFVHSPEPERQEEQLKLVAEAYAEDLDMAMPPPSAPSGPSGRHSGDFGFRARGNARHSRSRGSYSQLTNGHQPPSPIRTTSSSNIPRPESAGNGVVGAPTGPKAMRDPTPKPSSRQPSSSGGLSILGRASLAARVTEREPSPVTNGHDYPEADRAPRRQSSRQDRDSGRLQKEEDEYDRDRQYTKPRRDEYEDQEMKDIDNSRSNSKDRKHRSRRDKEKERYPSDSRRSSKRQREEDGDYDMNDYGEPIEDETKSRSHRKHRDEKYSKDRDRERDRPRERDRKRSRHDRDEEDEEDDRRHRSKHHKKEHAKDLESNGRSSHRSSQVPTPHRHPQQHQKQQRAIHMPLREKQRRKSEWTRRLNGERIRTPMRRLWVVGG